VHRVLSSFVARDGTSTTRISIGFREHKRTVSIVSGQRTPSAVEVNVAEKPFLLLRGGRQGFWDRPEAMRGADGVVQRIAGGRF